MLIIVPPSETKAEPLDDGPPVALGELSFPELTETRERILDALVDTSGRIDAFQRLHTRPSKRPRSRATPGSSTSRHAPHSRSTPARSTAVSTRRRCPIERAPAPQDSLVVASPLWGAIRPSDRIPSYRLHICSRLVGMDRLEPTWREVLPDVLADAAGPRGVIVDLRSSSYQAMGMPTGLADRTAILKVDYRSNRRGRIGDVDAKRIRGQAARLLLESHAEPGDLDALAGTLGERWPVRLEGRQRAGKPSTLTISVDD